MPQYRQLQITARLGLKEERGCERMEEDMIEIICNKDESDKPAKKSKDSSVCIRRPKNIKQIGDVSSDKKIYIEDYAFTYINSIAYNNPEEEQAGVLLGELTKEGAEKCVFVKGVIKAALKDAAETGIYFNEGVWNKIYSDIEKYFPDLSVVGWFAVVPQVTDERMARLKKLHLDNFAGNMKTLYLVDTVEKRHFAAVLPNVDESCFVNMNIGNRYESYVAKELPSIIWNMFKCMRMVLLKSRRAMCASMSATMRCRSIC